LGRRHHTSASQRLPTRAFYCLPACLTLLDRCRSRACHRALFACVRTDCTVVKQVASGWCCALHFSGRVSRAHHDQYPARVQHAAAWGLFQHQAKSCVFFEGCWGGHRFSGISSVFCAAQCRAGGTGRRWSFRGVQARYTCDGARAAALAILCMRTHYHVFKHLLDDTTSPPLVACVCSARKGRARENGLLGWNRASCSQRSQGDSTDCLTMLRDKGCKEPLH
jgi:hypothetical protein